MAVVLRRIVSEKEFLSICPTLDKYVPNKNPKVTTIFWIRHALSESNVARI